MSAARRSQDHPRVEARALNNLGVVFESADRYAEALGIVDRALELARRVGDRPWEENLLGGSLTALTLLGRWDEALARGAEFEKIPGAGASFGFLAILVEIHCARGNVADARRLLESQPDFRDSGDIQGRAGNIHAEARLLRAEGRPREGLAAAESGLALGSDLGISFYGVKLCLVEAIECGFELGDLAKVRELLGAIDALRPGELPPFLHAHGERFRGRLAAPEAEAAEGGFSRAAAMFRELEMPLWLAVTLLEHGEWLAAQDRAELAEPLLADAHEISERLEATPWLERAGRTAPVPA